MFSHETVCRYRCYNAIYIFIVIVSLCNASLYFLVTEEKKVWLSEWILVSVPLLCLILNCYGLYRITKAVQLHQGLMNEKLIVVHLLILFFLIASLVMKAAANNIYSADITSPKYNEEFTYFFASLLVQQVCILFDLIFIAYLLTKLSKEDPKLADFKKNSDGAVVMFYDKKTIALALEQSRKSEQPEGPLLSSQR